MVPLNNKLTHIEVILATDSVTLQNFIHDSLCGWLPPCLSSCSLTYLSWSQ